MRLTTVLLLACLALPAIASEAETPAFEPDPAWGPGYFARIETDLGRVVAKLLPEQAPQSVAHFVAMARGELSWVDPASGERKQFRYYDGIPIHNVRAGLLFEAGDWTMSGNQPAPFWAPPEGFGPVNFSGAGRLGMTRVGSKISAVQFFATAAAHPRLNGTFPCFGLIVEGIEVVRELSEVKTHAKGRPLEPPTIEAVHVFTIGNPKPLEEPRPLQPRRKVVPKMRDDVYDNLKKRR